MASTELKNELTQEAGIQTLKGEHFFQVPGFPLAVFPMPVQYASRTLHRHDFIEIAVVRSGKGVHVTENHEYPIATGSVFVVLPGQVHGYTSEGLKIDNILCDVDRLNLPMFDLAKLPGYHGLFTIEPRLREKRDCSDHLRLSPLQLAHVESLIEELKTELLELPAGYQCMAAAILINLVCYLCRCYSESSDIPEWKVLQLSRLFTHLEENLAEAISVKEMTRLANMSESSLRRTFHEIVGCSPCEYVIRLRVRKACELLQHTNDPITDIAFVVGFHDSNYFTRQFRRVMDVTPSQFRRRFQIVSMNQGKLA